MIMRKIKTIGALLMASAILFTGCKDEIITSELTLDLSKKATVQAYIYAELNLTNQGLEYAPNGTRVLISIPNSAFNPSASGNWIDTLYVNNGFVQATVPVTSNGVTVQFIPAEFTYDQIQPYGSTSSVITKLYKYVGTNTIGSVKPGEIRTQQITYNSVTPLDNFVETVSKKFEAYADVDETNAGLEYVPQGTIVTIFNDGWSSTATVSAAGRFDANVPKSETVYFRFQALKLVYTDFPNTTVKNYRYTTSGYYTESSPVLTTLNFGGGELWQ
jgi:hypothetical protein